MPPISRRDFLKLGGLGLLGFSLPLPYSHAGLLAESLFPGTRINWSTQTLADPDDPEIQQGRVTSRLIWLYDQPSFKARRLKLFWRDSIVSITGVVISQDAGDYNRVWYEIGADGYAYSGTLQPVRTLLNAPTLSVPASGALAEVTVPYTDAHEKADTASHTAYRMYYGSAHWILSASTSPYDSRIWYQVLDDKWNELYYAPGEHLRFITHAELSPLSPEIPIEEKKIQVRLNDQLVLAYEGSQPVFATRAATGAALFTGIFTTPTGHFMTYHKRPARHMANGDLTSSGYDLPGVPWVMYFTESGLSLHGTYWHNDFGHPKSHGCVNLSIEAAKWLFRWTNPNVEFGKQYAYEPIGTALEIIN